MTTDALGIYFPTILNFIPNALYPLMSLFKKKKAIETVYEKPVKPPPPPNHK